MRNLLQALTKLTQWTSFPRLLILGLIIYSLDFTFHFAKHKVRRLLFTENAKEIRGHDDLFYFYWLRSPLIDGDVDFRNDMELTMPPEQLERNLTWAETNRTNLGLIPNKYAVGWAIMNVPWFTVGHLTTHLSRIFGSSQRPLNGFSRYYQIAIILGNIIYGYLGLYVCFLFLCKYLNKETAIMSTMMVWSASSMIFYSVVSPSMSHHIVFLLLGINLLFTLKTRESSKKPLNWLVLGISAGLLVITRFQCVVYLLFPAAVVVRLIFEDRRLLKYVFLALGAILICISPQLIAWKALYGEWILYSYQGEGFNWTSPEIFNVLFSPMHGWIYWHPIMLLCSCALFFFGIRKRDLIIYALIVVIVTYINASWHSWWFGAAYGNRAFEGAIILVMIGYGLTYQGVSSTKLGKLTFLVISMVLVIWNYNLLYLIVGGPLGMEEPVTYQDILAATLRKWDL